METKMILDCTLPAPPEQFPQKCRVPPEVVDRVQPRQLLRDWTPGTKLTNA
jgi:2,5-furandicarboxylate decarboxylase 1